MSLWTSVFPNSFCVENEIACVTAIAGAVSSRSMKIYYDDVSACISQEHFQSWTEATKCATRLYAIISKVNSTQKLPMRACTDGT